jgi:hypothetical protein
MKCVACDKHNGVQNSGLVLCEKCLKPNAFKLITKANAMKQYFLTNKDLIGIPYAIGWPTGASNTQSILYVIDTVEDVAIKKYGTRENAIKIIKERDQKKKYMKERKECMKIDRQKELTKYLEKLKLNHLHNELFICNEYVQQGAKCEYTLEDIGGILNEIEFYINKVDYRSRIKDVRHQLHKRHGKSVTENAIVQETMNQCLIKYVRDNYMDHHKMIDEMPATLREKAFKLSDMFYLGKTPEIDDKDSDLFASFNDCINEIQR